MEVVQFVKQPPDAAAWPETTFKSSLGMLWSIALLASSGPLLGTTHNFTSNPPGHGAPLFAPMMSPATVHIMLVLVSAFCCVSAIRQPLVVLEPAVGPLVTQEAVTEAAVTDAVVPAAVTDTGVPAAVTDTVLVQEALTTPLEPATSPWRLSTTLSTPQPVSWHLTAVCSLQTRHC